MLVLSRKECEQVTVGPVTFTIVKIRGSSVRVGIDAPDDYLILRGELDHTQKKEEVSVNPPVSQKEKGL